jgi:hypothetical protein
MGRETEEMKLHNAGDETVVRRWSVLGVGGAVARPVGSWRVLGVGSGRHGSVLGAGSVGRPA